MTYLYFNLFYYLLNFNFYFYAFCGQHCGQNKIPILLSFA